MPHVVLERIRNAAFVRPSTKDGKEAEEGPALGWV